MSAFGCGFNETPPQCVASILSELFMERFDGKFRHATLAVLDDENCKKLHNPEGNIKV